MNKVIHRNEPYYGKTTTIILEYGYAYVMVSLMRENKDIAIIHDLCVHKDRRGEGLGRALLEEAAQEAEQMDAKRIRLSTAPNSWLETWYKRHGFEPVGYYDRDLMGYHDNVIMEKEIKEGQE